MTYLPTSESVLSSTAVVVTENSETHVKMGVEANPDSRFITVDKCCKEDLPGVAALHRRIYYKSNRLGTTALDDYYRQIFFENPWVRDDMSSFVARDGAGNVTGFLGVIPRPMSLGDRTAWAAITHRLMAAPGRGSELTAARLVRRLLVGSQDLWLSDGANDSGRRAIEAVGGVTLLPYSMNWIRVLRPFRYATSLLANKGIRNPIPLLDAVACGIGDRLAKRFVRKMSNDVTRSADPIELDSDVLLSCVENASHDRRLRPRYDRDSLRWLLGVLTANTNRGELRGFAIPSTNRTWIGSCLYYAKQNGVAEVLQIAARPAGVAQVLATLFRRAWDENLTCVMGRLEPAFLPMLWDQNCLLKRGSWAMAYSAHPDIMRCMLTSDMYLSCLEAELWLRSPYNVL